MAVAGLAPLQIRTTSTATKTATPKRHYMRPLKPICRSKKPRANGTAFIYFPFYHDGEHKVLLNTEIAIPPEYWNNRLKHM
jgi:hypothetical protein